MKKVLGALLLSLLVLTGAQAQTAYDAAKVKAAMQTNFGALGTIKKAIDAADTLATADGFWSVVQANRGLLAMNPPKGDKAAWDKSFNDLISAALEGTGAAGAKDWEKARAALAKLRASQGAGHSAFR